jgi:hypothetical protein
MTTPWSSLYCPSNDTEAIIVALRESLSALGYELYNPFGILPGKAYRQSVKLFAAPHNGWVRVIGTPDERQLSHLSQSRLCLFVSLDVADARIEVYTNGERSEVVTALAPHLRGGYTRDDLHKALAGEVTAQSPVQSPQSDLPLSALPAEVQALAEQVNPLQAQKLFSRLSADVLKKVSGDAAQVEGARVLVSGGAAPDWNSAGGQRIRALMACLTDDNWREPDFTALRDAYPLHERHRRNPKARLYPSDEAVMAQVPNALDYVPIYGGIV